MPDSKKKINDSENAKLFRTRMDIFVLNALDEKDGHGYGYDVIAYIQEHTKGHYKIKSISTIYNILKRLEASGYVSSTKGGSESYGAARVYYTLTPAGKEYLEAYKREWKYIRTLLDNLVSDEIFDLDSEEPPYSASELKPLTRRNRESGASDEDMQDAPEEEVSEVDAESFSEASSENEMTEEAADSVDLTENETKYVSDEDEVTYYDYTSEDDAPLPIEEDASAEGAKDDAVASENPLSSKVPMADDTNDAEDAVAAEEAVDVASEEEERGQAVFIFHEKDYDKHEEIPEFTQKQPVISYTAEERAEHLKKARKALFGTDSEDELARMFKSSRESDSARTYRPILPENTDTDRDYSEMASGVSRDRSSQNDAPDDIGLKEKVVALDDKSDESAHQLLSPYMEKLKKQLSKEGYTLSTFSSARKVNSVRYLLSNKIMRDTSIASFFYLVVTLLVTYLFKNVFGVTPVSTIIVGAIGLVAPVSTFILCLRDPDKKKKDAVNIKLLISALVLVYIVLFMAFVVYYLFTSKYNFLSPQMYAPAIILSTVPFFGVMYAVLHGSGKYSK